tara:strand:+ start:4083 stop:4730 length:648 start_codon:yes stop_codon:yes gene_type:complete
MAAKKKPTPTAKPTVEQILNRDLPEAALKVMPHKQGMTAISPIYVTDRMNEAFGIGGWQFEPEVINDSDKMVIVRGVLTIPSINARIVQFGGNDNRDRGDAYKGAATDALTKCCSYLGVGAHVWRNNQPREVESASPAPAQPRSKPNSASQRKKAEFDRVAELEKALEKHEEAANKLLAEIGWIETGQTFRDLDETKSKEVLSRPADFLAKALAA